MAKKLPVWIKTNGKYEPIPYHLMHTFPDGKRGFYNYETWHPNTESISQFYLRHSRYFEYDAQGTRSRLIFLGYKRRSWIDIGYTSATTIIMIAACIDLVAGAWWLAAITMACFAVSIYGTFRRYWNYF